MADEKTDIAPPATADNPIPSPHFPTHSAGTTSNNKRSRETQTTPNGLNRPREGIITLTTSRTLSRGTRRAPCGILRRFHWSAEQTSVYEEAKKSGDVLESAPATGLLGSLITSADAAPVDAAPVENAGWDDAKEAEKGQEIWKVDDDAAAESAEEQLPADAAAVETGVAATGWTAAETAIVAEAPAGLE
ncbi:hypothetical protein LTR74_014135 [Friedmanniomyces endolithicus]|nr:hypothetical protein LTR74_014135 [Friedmanniomyces endolithicus]